MNYKKVHTFVLSVCLAIAVAGCSLNEALPPETDSPAIEPAEEVDSEIPPVETDTPDEYTNPKEFAGLSEDYLYKKYESFAEAYLDILEGNCQALTDGQISDFQKRSGLYVGEGKIAIIDIFGDETPELLCLYYKYTDTDSSLYLKIYAYSETKGTESVFDDVIYPVAGGEHNYCVYVTRDGEPMAFLWSGGAVAFGGFWPIIPNQDIRDEKSGFYYNRDLAKLWYIAGVEIEACAQNGEEITKDQFDKASMEIMGNIERVLFQGAVLGELGPEPRLYKDVELWRDITPFEEDNMTYAEAVSWLEGFK